MKNRKHTKLMIIVTVLVIALLAFSGCSSNRESDTNDDAAKSETTRTLEIGALKGPTGMGMAPLMAKSDEGKTENDYTFTVAGSPDQLVAGLTGGNLDIAAIPSNAAATLYQKTEGDIQILAVNTLGVLSILEKGDTIDDVADLAGKTIVAAGKGSTAEYVLNYLLNQAGLTVGDEVQVEYKAEHSEVASAAQAGQADVVLLPEPFTTTLMKQAGDYRIAIDITEAWESQGNQTLPMGSIAVKRDLVEDEPELVATFLDEYAASVNTCNSDIDGSAAIIAQYEILDEAVAKEAIPRCHIVCLTGDEMKQALLPFYEVLFGFDPVSIGGAIPEDDFFVSIR